MNWMTFVVDLTKAGAWPLVGGIAAWRLGPKLSTGIGQFLRGRQWKASGFGVAVEAGEAVVVQQAERLEESMAKAIEPGPDRADPAATDRADVAASEPGSVTMSRRDLESLLAEAVDLGSTATYIHNLTSPPELLVFWQEGLPMLTLVYPSGTKLPTATGVIDELRARDQKRAAAVRRAARRAVEK